MCQIQQCRYIEHGLKDIAFYVQKHIAHRTVSYNFPLVRNKLLGAHTMFINELRSDIQRLNGSMVTSLKVIDPNFMKLYSIHCHRSLTPVASGCEGHNLMGPRDLCINPSTSPI